MQYKFKKSGCKLCFYPRAAWDKLPCSSPPDYVVLPSNLRVISCKISVIQKIIRLLREWTSFPQKLENISSLRDWIFNRKKKLQSVWTVSYERSFRTWDTRFSQRLPSTATWALETEEVSFSETSTATGGSPRPQKTEERHHQVLPIRKQHSRKAYKALSRNSTHNWPVWDKWSPSYYCHFSPSQTAHFCRCPRPRYLLVLEDDAARTSVTNYRAS
jgi:hypothetical protein